MDKYSKYKRNTRITVVLLSMLIISITGIESGLAKNPSYSENITTWDKPFYPNGTYNSSIPKPDDIIGQPLGKYPVRYDDVVRYITTLANESPLVELREYGRTHEGRTLYYLIISSSDNIANLNGIKNNLSRLADPRLISDSREAKQLADETPAVAWMAYTIHGDELSGTDAALQVAYQLAAGTDDLSRRIRNNVVTLIDPLQNPDGRERFLHMLQTYGSKTPNYDKHSMQHNGVWPSGRTNHYLFDLNRDYLAATQPETQGRIKTIVEWHPQLVVDAHEMWADATFLFSPPRQPINYNTPDNVMKWYEVYHDNQAEAFDKYGWSYYSGDWNEQWFPGFGSAWPTFKGAVGILYEQAGVDGELVLQHDGNVLSYYEAVHHQFTSSISNLTTTADNRFELLVDYYNTRLDIMRAGEKDKLSFIYVPGEDTYRMNKFINTLLMQGIEVYRTTESFSGRNLKDIFHNEISRKDFPAGAYIVSTDQPNGALAKAILEFDPHLKKSMLEKERRELEKEHSTLMYEVSAWSLSLAFGIEAYYTERSLRVDKQRIDSVEPPRGKLVNPKPRYGYLINNSGDLSSRALVELFARELVVYIATEPFTIEGRKYRRGTLLIRNYNNPDNLSEILREVAGEYGVEIYGVNTAAVEEGYDLGSTRFTHLEEPYVAICAHNPMEWGSFGSLWYLLDNELGIPHSLINFSSLGRTPLDNYNIIIVPAVWGGPGNAKHILGEGGIYSLKNWVKNGGTLIMVESSAYFAADSSSGFSQVKLLRQALDKAPVYKKMAEMERRAQNPPVDTMALWHPEKVKSEDKIEFPSLAGDIKTLEKLDRWQRLFHPRGTYMKVDINDEHWLAFGSPKSIPALLYTDHALLSANPVSTVGRLATENDLRLSGLLWPEARQRWAETSYLTRERLGRGQVILFADQPYLRAYHHATKQLFVNALLLGPSFLGGHGDY